MGYVPGSPTPPGPDASPLAGQVIKQTTYAAFMMTVQEAQMMALKGVEVGFIEPGGHKHAFFLTPSTIADLRLGLARCGYSGLDTVGDIHPTMPHNQD